MLFLFLLLIILILIIIIYKNINYINNINKHNLENVYKNNNSNTLNINYKIENDKIEKNNYTYKFTTNQSDFKNDVRNIIKNSGWNEKFNFKETIDNNYDIGIGLKSREYMNKTNVFNDYDSDGNKIYLSRTWIKVPSYLKKSIKSNSKEIEIDENNWYYGVKKSKLSRDEYKKYVINHEIGHAIGYDHRICKNGEKCPIMYQMTKGPPENSIPSYEVNIDDINYIRPLN